MHLAATVKRAIRSVPAALKASAVFSRVVQGTYTPATDTTTGDATQNFTASGPLIAVDADQLRDVAPAEVARYRDLILAASDCTFPPSAADTTCVIAGTTWRVIGVDELAPDGATPALYVVRLHR